MSTNCSKRHSVSAKSSCTSVVSSKCGKLVSVVWMHIGVVRRGARCVACGVVGARTGIDWSGPRMSRTHARTHPPWRCTRTHTHNGASVAAAVDIQCAVRCRSLRTVRKCVRRNTRVQCAVLCATRSDVSNQWRRKHEPPLEIDVVTIAPEVAGPR